MSDLRERASKIAEHYTVETRDASIRVSGSPGGLGDLSALRQMAMRELKRENIGVRREGYDFVVDPEAITAFVQTYQQLRPDISYFEPQMKSLGRKQPQLALLEVAPEGIGAREKRLIREDHERIERETREIDEREKLVLARMTERRHLIRLRETAASGMPQIEDKVSDTIQLPLAESVRAGLTRLAFSV